VTSNVTEERSRASLRSAPPESRHAEPAQALAKRSGARGVRRRPRAHSRVAGLLNETERVESAATNLTSQGNL